jgi:hypothetical protein
VAHKPEWLTEDAYFLRDTTEKIGLSFEYVALRDIDEGEEIFMDYGDEWQAAWDEHVKQWEPPEEAINYVHSTEWPENYFRTTRELDANPYPPNLHTMCQESYRMVGEGTYEWIPVLRPDSSIRVYCNVLERHRNEDGTNVYTVAMDVGDDEWIIVHKVTEKNIFLYDKAFSADWHLPSVFRHEIMIPDDVMPPSWMNGPPVHPF